jgi:hypothetical protein
MQNNKTNFMSSNPCRESNAICRFNCKCLSHPKKTLCLNSIAGGKCYKPIWRIRYYEGFYYGAFVYTPINYSALKQFYTVEFEKCSRLSYSLVKYVEVLGI